MTPSSAIKRNSGRKARASKLQFAAATTTAMMNRCVLTTAIAFD